LDGEFAAKNQVRDKIVIFPSQTLSALSALFGFVITIMLLSYLIGDNPFFRAAINIFIGVSVGYVLSVAWHQVIWPQLMHPVLSGRIFREPAQALTLIPMLGSILLLMKVFPRLNVFGQLPMAYLAGVGAAVSVGGAIIGTMLPQLAATMNAFDLRVARLNPFYVLFSSVLILLGVLGTLAYFHFGARREQDGSIRRNALIVALTWIGRVYIAISFGVLFAGVYMAALTAFISRVDSLRELMDAIGRLF